MGKRYSLDYLESISGGDKDFMEDMLRTFVQNVPDELENLNRLIQQSNWQKVGEQAHKFGSNLLYLELEDLKKIALKIETFGLEMEHINEIPVLFEELKNGCYAIIEDLKNDFSYLP
jgi:HPt (histidine-containing phosphotransfer) domain-containing protein